MEARVGERLKEQEGGTNLEEHDEVLVHANGHLVLIHLITLDLLPLILLGILLRALDIQSPDLFDEHLHAGIIGHFLALPHFIPTDAQGGVGAVEKGLHDGSMLARVDGGHLDRVSEEWEVLESDGFVFVVADNVVHHEGWGKGRGWGGVAGEVEAGCSVVRGVHDVEGICSLAAE